jgi:hypothetical protein
MAMDGALSVDAVVFIVVSFVVVYLGLTVPLQA